MNNEQLFCIYCDNILFPYYNLDETNTNTNNVNTYLLKCMNCNYIRDLPNDVTLFKSSTSNTNQSNVFDFDENDIIYDYSLQRFRDYNDTNNEYVLLNDRNMKKIYINVDTKEIHSNLVINKKDIIENSTDKQLTKQNLQTLLQSQLSPKSKSDNTESTKPDKKERKTKAPKKESKPKSSTKSTEKSKQEVKETSKTELESTSTPINQSQSQVLDRTKWSKDNDIFFFYSGSANKPAGKGTNEFLLNKEDKDKYYKLNEIKNWRHILSNFWHADFIYNGLTYHTAEHAFQGAKISLVDPIKGKLFSVEHSIDEKGIESGIGSSTDGNTARSKRKLVVLEDQSQLKEWDRIKYQVLEDILFAKFTQNELPRKVLLSTKDAILTHGTRGVEITRQIELENVRNRIRLTQELMN
jgi:predicted NAD-dependent protein-ADP-ribosyltransferase YbiA (DUF1768 family)